MSEFHYVRIPGDEGGVDACEGTAIGLELDALLEDGLPPWKVALTLVASICEILDITQEDGELHGNINPLNVFIDETGAVSIEGFGAKPTTVSAPEGSPTGTSADLYGLGRVAYQIMTGQALPAMPTDSDNAHDDAVIDVILTLDLAEVPDEMQGDIQWFIAKLLSFHHEDRPPAVEAWRTFIAFADATPGPEIEGWCNLALDGGGVRRGGGAISSPVRRLLRCRHRHLERLG